MLGRLAADERAAGLAAARGDAADELGDLRPGRAGRPRRSRGRTSGSAPVQTTSSAHIATRSMPIVSNRPSAAAIAVFVPTPSVDDTSTRLAVAGRDRERAAEPAEPAERPPAGGSISTRPRISSTARSPASTSTPGRAIGAARGRSPGTDGAAHRRAESGHQPRPAGRALLEHELAARRVVRDGLRVAGRRSRRSRTARTAARARRARRGSRGSRANRRR